MIQQIKLNPNEKSLSGYRNDSVVFAKADGADGAFTTTLPDATTFRGLLAVKRVNAANNITLDTISDQTIDGASSLVLATQYDRAFLVSDGKNWHRLGYVSGANVTFGALICTTINALTITAAATGFTIAGGTTSKTLTVNDNFVVSTQLSAIALNTTHRTSNGTDHTYINQDLRTTAAPTFATGVSIGDLTLANGSITDSSGAISFGNETLTTTGSITGNSFITASNIGIAADTDLIQLTGANTMLVNGQLGVGVAPGTHNINSIYDVTNSNGYYGISSELYARTAADATYINFAGYFVVYAGVSGGTTNTGNACGLYGGAYHTGGGTINKLRGLQFAYGNSTTGSGTKVSTVVSGIFLTPTCQEGTVSNLYDIYINAPIMGGAITNEWCIYSSHDAPSRFVGAFQIASDTNGLVLGAGQDSSIRDSGSAMVLEYDLLNAGSRSILFQANTVTQMTFDGDLFFTGDGVGLPYGSCSGYHIAWTQAAAQNTWYNVSDADMIDGELNAVTHDGSGELTILKAGRYLLNVSCDLEVDAANKHIEIGFEISNSGSADTEGIVCMEAAGANNEYNMSTTAILDLAANATIEFCVRTTDAGNPTIAVDCINLNVTQIGGT